MGLSFWNRGQSMPHDAAFLARFTDLRWNNLGGCFGSGDHFDPVRSGSKPDSQLCPCVR
jgi:hypothetical protein